MRQLHIGPGRDKLPGFETLDIRPGLADHTADARVLPFPDQTFDLIYASHIIEHIPWYETDALLKEWLRVLTPGGSVEIWTVNGANVARLLLDAEDIGERFDWKSPDGWKRHGASDDPFKWCAGRLFAYGPDGDPNWHKALFTPRYLKNCLLKAGFADPRYLDRSKVRGKDHGWINLGMSATRPS
jgi:SAM-dependent methyltransferase